MIKKGVVFVALMSVLYCEKIRTVHNDYSFIDKIDKKFFTKGPTVVPEERLELYLIENENGKLVKKTVVNKKKESEDLKNRHSFLFNYSEGNLYLLFYKSIDIGTEPENIKIYYYDKNYNLKPLNDYEYELRFEDGYASDNKNKIKNIHEIQYISDGNVYYNIINEGGFENKRKIMEGENYVYRYRKNNGELKIYLSTDKEKKEKIYFYDTTNKTIKEEKITDYIEKCVIGSCIEVDNNNIVYSKKNLLIRRNLITKKEKIIYKAHNEIGGLNSLNKKNTLITFGVSDNGSIYSQLLGYINVWKWDHDVVVDLEEEKIYMLETGNLNLLNNEEQLRLISEIINYGAEME